MAFALLAVVATVVAAAGLIVAFLWISATENPAAAVAGGILAAIALVVIL